MSSLVGSGPPREPHRKERRSRLMLLRLASCFLKARSSFCSWSQETASLLKNYIFPSSTLTSLCKYQDTVGDWDRPEGEGDGSYPPRLLRKFIRLWYCSPVPTTPSCSTFTDTACSAGHEKKVHFQASMPRTTPSSSFPPKKGSSTQSKEEYPKVGTAKVNHDH